MSRKIANTDVLMQCDCPDDMLVQGGSRGLVLTKQGHYKTAFCEAFPPKTFLRGEGNTISEAEQDCFNQYQKLLSCENHPEHGSFERRSYRNGAGYCKTCDMWFSGVFEPLPNEEEPSNLEKALLGDNEELYNILNLLKEVKDEQ